MSSLLVFSHKILLSSRYKNCKVMRMNSDFTIVKPSHTLFIRRVYSFGAMLPPMTICEKMIQGKADEPLRIGERAAN